MSDTPQRANAAQIAQRNLKSMKQPRRRPLGGSPQPQQQSFAPPPQQGGLLFGSVQAPSDFNFSAGGPSISFPQASFGSSSNGSFGSNPPGTETESEDGRAGKDEEDKRKIPDFRKNQDHRPGTKETPMFASMPQEAQQALQGFMQKTQQDLNNPFLFGQSSGQQNNAQPAATNPFGAPANGQTPTPFSFGSTSTQPSANQGNIFGGATSQPAQPSSNPFSFGQSTSQLAQSQVPSSGFSFGQTATQSTSATTPFSFGQSSTQPTQSSTPSFTFGSSQPEAPKSNLFGSSQQPPTQPAQAPAMSNIFGGSRSQSPAPAPATSNIFGGKPQGTASPTSNLFGGTSQSTAPATSNIFGGSLQSPAPAPATNNIFGSKPQSPAPPTTNNLFGSEPQSPAPPMTNNLFGSKQQSPAPPTTSNLFGSKPQSPAPPTTSNLFGSKQQSPAPPTTNNLFGGNSQATAPATNNIFGRSSQSPTPTPATSNLFGEQSQRPAASAPSLFDRISKDSSGNPIRQTPVEEKSPSPNLFDRISKDGDGNPIRQVPTAEKENVQPNNNNIISGVSETPISNLFGQKSLPANNLFGTSTQQPAAPTNNLFGHLNQPLNNDANNSTNSQSATSPVPLGKGNKSFSPMKPVDPSASASRPPPSGMSPSLPSGTSQSISNNLFSKTTPSNPSTTATSQPDSSSDILAKSIEPKEVESNASNPGKVLPADIPDQFIRPLVPSHFTELQAKEFCAKYRMRALNKAMQKAFHDIPLGLDPAPVMSFYYDQRSKIVLGCEQWFQPSKRKAVFGDDQESDNPSKRLQQAATTNSTNGQATSLFKPQQPSAPQPTAQATSPSKSQPQINGSTTPKAPPPLFSNPPPSASPSKGKRKAEYQITDQDPEGKGAEERRMKMPKMNGSVGSETSNIFKNILDSPPKSSPEKRAPGRLETLEKTSNNEATRPNPFASIAVPGSPSKSTSNSNSQAPANMFAQKATSSPSKPATESSPAKPSNIFSQKPPLTTAPSTTEPIKPPTFGIKPPSFGTGPMNFLAQFGQQAKKDEKDNEEKLMEKAKEEDMDSDDDEAEWEARYKEKRRAELKAINDLAKSKRASFVVGKGFAFGEASKTSDSAATSVKQLSDPSPAKSIFRQSSNTAPTTSKSLFGQTSGPSSGTSLFGSPNGSRSSTPAGSVLDSHTPGKPVAFDGIFGHLSSANSPASSGQDDDSDDDSDPNAESDSENKDPTYQPAEPGSEAASGPTTPVEKTGAGIASAKKASSTPLSFGSTTQTLSSGKPLFGQTAPTSTGLFGSTASPTSGSGTSTPSLFDRISKDSNGNPIRQVPTDEKENTEPNTTNIFGGTNNLFGKSPSNPLGTPTATQSPDATQLSASKSLFGQADKTWKPDSPIRFTDATPNGTPTAPSVSVTEATPTKSNQSNPFAGLFGNSSTQKPASTLTGGLFGNSAIPKPAASLSGGVGFAFGGPSSTTSSLFPSAAVSTSTSRATSPGQTTDGDSAAEGSNDPDAEHHEQIDLTKGGPGEEDEDLIHEVRAKALKYSPKEEGDKSSPWVTKGLGPLRVLKHKETKAARVLLRADPSGTIVLNKGILAGVEYSANGKTLKFLAASDNGSGLETWMLQVKTPEFAKALADILEANKSSS